MKATDVGAVSTYALTRDEKLSDAATQALQAAGNEPTQQAILSDGTVTAEEHRLALESTALCIRSAGFDARVEGSNHPGIGIYGAVSKEVVRQCQVNHLDAVSFAWADQNRPTATDMAALYAETTTCFLARGGALSGDAVTRDKVIAILSNGTDDQRTALGACLESNRDRYGVPF